MFIFQYLPDILGLFKGLSWDEVVPELPACIMGGTRGYYICTITGFGLGWISHQMLSKLCSRKVVEEKSHRHRRHRKRYREFSLPAVEEEGEEEVEEDEEKEIEEEEIKQPKKRRRRKK